jgi:hypothetical protein
MSLTGKGVAVGDGGLERELNMKKDISNNSATATVTSVKDGQQQRTAVQRSFTTPCKTHRQTIPNDNDSNSSDGDDDTDRPNIHSIQRRARTIFGQRITTFNGFGRLGYECTDQEVLVA